MLQQNWQFCGNPCPVVVKFNRAIDSPGLALMLQPYVVNPRPFTQTMGYFSSPAYAGLSSAPMSTWSSWPGMQPAASTAVRICLAPGQEYLPEKLLPWAESELRRELCDKKAPGFEAAILSFLMVYKNSPLDLYGASSSSGKKKSPACIDPLVLVRKICEMRCWYMIWQTSKLYAHAHGGASNASGHANSCFELPRMALWELKKMASNALIACEKEILLELDELSPNDARLIELPLWACIWQMVLIYRQLVAGYSNIARSQPVSAGNGVNTGE